MNALAQTLLAAGADNLSGLNMVSKFSSKDVREAISALVAEEKLELADALCEAGLSLYPSDENILAIASLMASLHEDYARSEEYVRELIDLQHGQATEFTWNLLVRVLRCQAEPVEALSMVKAGLLQYPASADLLREKRELESLFGEAAMFVQPVAARQ